MRLLIKILKISAIVLVTLVALLLALTALYKDRVVEIFIEESGRRSDITITMSDTRLTLLRGFPKASVVVNDLLIASDPSFSGNDTLISVSRATFDFRLTDLLRKNYTIERVTLSGGILNILTDEKGTPNYPVGSNITDETGENLNLGISQIRVSNLKFVVQNDLKQISTIAYIESARLSGEIAGKEIGLRSEARLEMKEIFFDGISIGHPVEVSLSLDIHKSDSLISLTRGDVAFEKMVFRANGSWSPVTGETKISLLSENADIKSVASFIPEKVVPFAAWNPSGKISAGCLIEGIHSRESRLHYRLSFLAEGVSFKIPGKGLILSGSSISGSLTNGNLNDASSTELIISNFNINSAASRLGGSLSIRNFDNPVVVVELTTELDLLEASTLFGTLPLTGLSGSLRSSLRGSGYLPDFNDFDAKRLLTMNPAGTIFLNEASVSFDEYHLTRINGHLMLAEDLYIDSLLLSVNGQKMLLDGRIERFSDLLRGTTNHLHAEGSIVAERVEPTLFPTAKREKSDDARKSNMPDKITAGISFTIGEFSHRNFSANQATGFLKYSGATAHLQNFSARSMGGTVQGSLLVTPLDGGGYSTDSRLTFNNIDIKSAFTSFEEFGQSFISSSNLKGTLTGNYNMLMNLNHEIKSDLYSISSEGRFIISDGELISFEPVMKLSRFIEIAELQHIRFSRLENEFYIKGGIFAIPHMEIISSAAAIGVSGTHSFSGDYDYRLRVLLSQILSGKAPRSTTANEFGIIEDDGLGRTSVFLRISRADGRESIAYDVAAAGTQVRESLRRERETLRGILREEFGLFRRDTIAPPVEEQRARPQFRIIWEEGVMPPDTIKQDTIRRDQRNNPVRNLFNRIIKG